MSIKSDKKFQTNKNANRTFSEAFKRSKVEDIVKKRISIKDVSDLYEVSRTSIYKWIYLYSDVEKETKTVVQMESESHKNKVLLARLAEYERIIGQKQIEIDVLEKGFELASVEIGYDIKKKYVRRPLSGSEDTLKLMDIK